MPELMKGKVFSEHKHKLVYPVVAEVKYDEIRLHVKYQKAELCGDVFDCVKFLSYDGKPLYNLESFAVRFREFFRANPEYTELDMGLLVNGNFNDSYRWARSSKGIPQEKLDKKTGKVAPALHLDMVQFMLFDVPDFGHLPFDTDTNPDDGLDRRAIRKFVQQELRWSAQLPVCTPRTLTVDHPAGLDRLFEMVREDGEEGLMVKSRDHKYLKGKRIDGWLKMKPEAEADGVIVGLTEAVSEDGTPLGRAGSVTVQVPATLATGPVSLASPHGIPHELGRLMWQNPEQYIGQWCEFKYMERDRAGGYRHPTFGRLRESK